VTRRWRKQKRRWRKKCERKEKEKGERMDRQGGMGKKKQ
jgi:hypothetical protein